MTGSDETRITYVGHATVMIEMNGQRIITDPILRDRFMVLQRHGASIDAAYESPSVQIVLLSHMHFDHADPASIRRLPDDAVLIVPRGAGLYLQSRVPQRLIEVSAGERVTIGSLTIVATPAAHAGGRPPWILTSTALGYMIQGKETIYFAGDTDLFDGMETLGATYDIDVALLPIAGYSPHVPNGHLNPQTAARALRMLRARVAIPIHWGAFRPLGPVWKQLGYLNDPPYTFAGYASYLAPETQVQVLVPGESISLRDRVEERKP